MIVGEFKTATGMTTIFHDADGYHVNAAGREDIHGAMTADAVVRYLCGALISANHKLGIDQFEDMEAFEETDPGIEAAASFYRQLGDGDEVYSFVPLNEVCIRGTPERLKALGEFLIESSTMSDDHAHFQTQGGVKPDFVVVKSDE
jgi:hypothetical protein